MWTSKGKQGGLAAQRGGMCALGAGVKEEGGIRSAVLEDGMCCPTVKLSS